MIAQLVDVFKLRIGFIMAITALVTMVVTPGQMASMWDAVILSMAVLIASASAGAFNQYYEWDLDAHMPRTSRRPFVTGVFKHDYRWLVIIIGLLVFSVGWAAVTLNEVAALFIFLGAFSYAIVYTVWLKRRTWWNIVVGGSAGSFAVLAGAAAIDPELGPIPVILSIVLFLWTPSHFWSLAIAQHKSYAEAGVPMLPVVVGDELAAKAVLWNTLLLVGISILPYFYGMGWLYLLGAVSGGGYFIYRNIQMVHDPSRKVAMSSFFASLIQLIVLLVFAVADVLLLG